MVEQAVPGDGRGRRSVHWYSSDAATYTDDATPDGAPPSAIALMMTNSNNSWKAHRPNGRPSPLRQREASGKKGEERQHGGLSFGKGEKLRRKSTPISQV